MLVGARHAADECGNMIRYLIRHPGVDPETIKRR